MGEWSGVPSLSDVCNVCLLFVEPEFDEMWSVIKLCFFTFDVSTILVSVIAVFSSDSDRVEVAFV